MSDTSGFIIKDGVLENYFGRTHKVIIPDGVTSIGNNVFSWRSNLTSVTLPDGVTSIGKHTFYRCNNLTSININNLKRRYF